MTQPNTELLTALSDILAVVFDVAVNGHLMGEPRHLSPEDATHIYDIARNAIMKAEGEAINRAYQHGMPVRDGVTTAADAERFMERAYAAGNAA